MSIEKLYKDLKRTTNTAKNIASNIFSEPSDLTDLAYNIAQSYGSERPTRQELMDIETNEMRRDDYILRRFQGDVNRILETSRPNDIKAQSSAKKQLQKTFNRFSEKHPQLTEDMDIEFNYANKLISDNIDTLNKYSQDKFMLRDLEKEQQQIIKNFSELESEELAKDPKKALKAKEDLLLFYNKLSSLSKSSSNYMQLGLPDFQDHAVKLKNMTQAHNGILRNLDILNINESVLSDADIVAINYALQGDSSQLNEILTSDRMLKNTQRKDQYDKIIKGIEVYTQADNNIRFLDFDEETGTAIGEDGSTYSLGQELQKRDASKKMTQELIDGYAPFDLQLRGFKSVHPTINIPWDKSEDYNFEDQMLMKEFNVSQDDLSKNRKQWEAGGSEGEFSDWFRKNYQEPEDNKDKDKGLNDIDPNKGLNAQDIVDAVFEEVENPTNPRNPTSIMKSVTYTTSKETQKMIKDNYGSRALRKLHKLYQKKKKFGEDSPQYKKEFESFESYLEKQSQKKKPKEAPKPTESQLDELNKGIIEYNKRFGIGR
tara:strand:+ start:427 stop:2055 length:1629 start_codon:yes stop_codon:yes gene_type:complete